jgi:hypothetical protein
MNYKKAIIYLITGLTLFRLIYINFLPLLGDEAYYWQWSRHLDLGYYEQGPMTALVIWFFTFFNKINTVFTIRLGAVVLSLLTSILSVLIYRRLYPDDKDSKQSFFNLLFMNSALIYAAGSVLMMHDTVMMFFFALFIYQMLAVLEKPGDNMSWAHAGIILALGVMSKYTLAVVYPAVILFLFVSGYPKKYAKGPVFFSLFFFLFLAPVIYWNCTHDLATLKFLIFRKGGSTALTIRYFGELIGSQMVLVSVFLFPFLAAALWKNLKKRALTGEYFLAFIFTVSFLPFLILALKNKVEANWPAFCFLPLFFITTRHIFSIKGLKRPVFHGIYAAGLAVALLLQVQLVCPLIPLPEKSNPLRKALGYKELAEKMDSVYNDYGAKGPLFFSTRHYQAASLLAFYLKGQPDVYILEDSDAMKNYRFWDGYKKLKGYNSIFAWSEDWETWEIGKFFTKHNFVEKVEVKKGSDVIRSYNIDFLEGLK